MAMEPGVELEPSGCREIGLAVPAALRVVSYNIQCGIGADGKYDIQRICDWFSSLIPQPDIIALQELDRNQTLRRNTSPCAIHADGTPGAAVCYEALSVDWVQINSL